MDRKDFQVFRRVSLWVIAALIVVGALNLMWGSGLLAGLTFGASAFFGGSTLLLYLHVRQRG